MINVIRRIGMAGAMVGLVSVGIAISASPAQAARREQRNMQLESGSIGPYVHAAPLALLLGSRHPQISDGGRPERAEGC